MFKFFWIFFDFGFDCYSNIQRSFISFYLVDIYVFYILLFIFIFFVCWMIIGGGVLVKWFLMLNIYLNIFFDDSLYVNCMYFVKYINYCIC